MALLISLLEEEEVSVVAPWFEVEAEVEAVASGGDAAIALCIIGKKIKNTNRK